MSDHAGAQFDLLWYGGNRPINALRPVVYIPVDEYVYLLNCSSFRGDGAAPAAVDTFEDENSFSDKLHQHTPTSSYLQRYRFILLNRSVLYEHVEHALVHEYMQTLAASCAAQHVLCRVCCVLSVLSTQPSVHPDSSSNNNERGGLPF